MTERIGITGGIGSGKSMVVRFLESYAGIGTIDLDVICREVLAPGGPGLVALRQRYGSRFIDSAGQLERKTLRHVIFSDSGLRKEVDSILHPLAKQALLLKLADSDQAQVLLEIPLLFEAGWQDLVDQTVLVYADPATRCRRIQQRDRVDREEAVRAMAAQWPLDEKVFLSDHVIDNSGPWPVTCLYVMHLAGLLCRAKKNNLVLRKSLTELS